MTTNSQQANEEALLGERPNPLVVDDGRDEMNLAEYPIALLADRAPDGIKTVVYHDKDETLTITGSDLLGLPTALDVDVIIGLLRLTKTKTNFQNTTVNFTRYELIEALRWSHNGFYYERLTESLNRWVGVTLIYKKSWWDNDTKSKGNLSFHILDSVNIVDQVQRRSGKAADRATNKSLQIPLPLSSVRWSNEFFKSFQANNLKKLDLDVYFSLRSAITKQLYRFLDKRFYRKAELSFDLRTLACEHVGMSRNYETWRLKQKLQPAIDELIEVGFLKPLSTERQFKRAGRGQWTVNFVRAGEIPAEERTIAGTIEAEQTEPSELEAELISLGVQLRAAGEFVRTLPKEQIEFQIEHVEWLRKHGKRKIQNPGGYLAQAIRDDLPRTEGFVTKAEKVEQQRAANQRRKSEQEAARRKRERIKQSAEEKAVVESYWMGLSEDEQKSLREEILATADPERVKVYRDMPSRLASVAEGFFRISIRDPYIRMKLGLPPEDGEQ